MYSLSKLRMIKKLLFIAIALPTLGFITSSSMLIKDKGIKVGKKAPMMNVSMEAVDGNNYSLNDLMGENGLFVVFSCNTCPFVVGNDKFEGWEKQYNDLHTSAKEGKIGFVLVNSNEAKRNGVDSKAEMFKHSMAAEYTMNYLVDHDSELADAFGAKTTPHFYAINAKGKVVFMGSIDNSWDSGRENLETYALDVVSHLSNGTALPAKTSAPRGCSIKRN